MGALLISYSVITVIYDATTLFLTQLVKEKPVTIHITLQKISQGCGCSVIAARISTVVHALRLLIELH